MLTDNIKAFGYGSSHGDNGWLPQVAHSAIPLIGCDLFAAKRVATLLWSRPSRSACQSQLPAAASGQWPAAASGWSVVAASQPTPASVAARHYVV